MSSKFATSCEGIFIAFFEKFKINCKSSQLNTDTRKLILFASQISVSFEIFSSDNLAFS